jgi:mannosyltransferase
MIQIDGIIYSLQRKGGISAYTSQLIQHLQCRHIPSIVTMDGEARDPGVLDGVGIPVAKRAPRWQERYRSCRIVPEAQVFHSIYLRKPARASVPTVVTVYDFVYERYYSGLQRLVHSRQKRAAIRAAQAVICISHSTRDDLLEFVGETAGQTITVTHLAVSDVFRKISVDPSDTPFVLFVGERHSYKNFATLLAAMEFLPDLEVHCVGGGALRPEELAAAPEAIRKRVRHLGFVDDETLNARYNQAECLVYPSVYEGFGIPVLEAMRAGCPVVCIRCSAVLEVGRDALTVAEANDARAIAHAIDRVRMPGHRHEVISRGLEVVAGYSWQATHDQTLAVYRTLGVNIDAAT